MTEKLCDILKNVLGDQFSVSPNVGGIIQIFLKDYGKVLCFVDGRAKKVVWLTKFQTKEFGDYLHSVIDPIVADYFSAKTLQENSRMRAIELEFLKDRKLV